MSTQGLVSVRTASAGLLERFRELRDLALAKPVRSRWKCEACEDTGRVDLGAGQAGGRRCRCQPPVEVVLAKAGVPPELRAVDLRCPPPGASVYWAAIRALVVAEMRRDGRPRSVYLQGGTGTGKTWAAAGAIRLAVELHGWSVAWVVARDFLRELRSVYQRRAGDGGPTEAEVVERYRAPRLLVLDELPRDRVSPAVAGELETLFNHRREWGLSTIATGNLSSSLLTEFYSPEFASRLGPADFDLLRFEGPDLRLTPPARLARA